MGVISKMTFDNGSTKNLISSTFYGKCSQTGDVAAKTVTIGGWDETTKSNVSGTTIHVLFSNGNSAANPTLNVDNQGAHPIYIEEDVKASSFPAGIYALTLTQLTVSGQETWCWLMDAKAVSANYATSAGSATSASSVPWSGVTNPPATYTPTSHSHGNIDNSGTISATATATNGDTIIISDSSASGALVKGPTFGNATDTYLRNDGTWTEPEGKKLVVPLSTNEETGALYNADIPYSDVLSAFQSGIPVEFSINSLLYARVLSIQEETSTYHTGSAYYWSAHVNGVQNSTGGVVLVQEGMFLDPQNQTGCAFAPVSAGRFIETEFPGSVPGSGDYVLHAYAGAGSWSTIDIPITKPSQDGTYSLNVSGGESSWTAVAPSGLQPPSANGHYILGVNGSAVTWEDTTLTVAIASGDKLLIADSSDGNKIKSATAAFGSSTNTYLKNNGTWGQPSLNEISGTDDLRAIEGLTGNSGLLKKTASNTWTLDTTTYSTLTLGETSSTAYRGDRGKTAYDHASETKSGQVTSGFYKFSVTSQGHIASTTVVTKSDITGLGIPAQDTTYVFDGTYDSSTNKAATVKTVTDKIEALDKTVTGADPSKTLASLSETDGIISATFTPISITKSQVSDFAHSHGNISNGGTITATASASTEDSIIISDSSASGALVKGPSFGTNTSKYLRNDGEWSTPTVSWSEVSGKPSEFTPSSHTHTWSSITNPPATYTPSSHTHTWSSITNPPTSYTPTSHTHGNISNGGTISATATATNSDSLIMSDSSASGALVKGPTFGTSTSTYLRNDGTWATPSVSGYIPTSEKGAASGVATLDTNSKVPIVQSNYLYGKCTTSGSTAAKTVTIAGYDESTIANMEGVTVFIAFKNVSTASNPTLNVSGAGAHPIVTGTYDDPVAIGKFTNGLHAFTLVKALDNSYYWWINEGRDTVPEAPTTTGTYLLTINSSGNVSWSSYTPPTAATTGTITIGASGWSGNGPYSHSVTISGTTANSKIDLQPDSTVLAQMTTDGTTALYIENNNGTLTAWAMGAAPTAALTIQYTKTEVG